MNRVISKKTSALATESEVEAIEIALLTEAIYRRWGYDFRDYSLVSLKRRVLHIIKKENFTSISTLQERLLRDRDCMELFLTQVTVNVTSMFRDPSFYREFRAKVIPLLKQYDRLRIWDAGCATGEEVYSLAILLHEEGLLERSLIYATDLNQTSLDVAKTGIYTEEKMQEFNNNYQAAGGKANFSDYYQISKTTYKPAMRESLSTQILWGQHNLVTDASFNEFQLILCRNVMIYFNPILQARVHCLLYESLTPEGILVLGRQENLQLTPYASCYKAVDIREKIYQWVGSYYL